MSNVSMMTKQGLNVEPGELKKILQVLRSDILEDVDTKIQTGIDRIVLELELKRKKTQNSYTEKSTSSKESRNPKELPQKEFSFRNSTLTDLWENAEACSLYNACCAFFGLVYIYIAIFYCFNVQRLKRDLSIVCWTFGQFHIVVSVWLAINFSIVFILYPTFRFWATNRTFVKKKRFYDAMFCCLFILYEIALFATPPVIVIACDIPVASSFTLLIEKVRLFMKSYAFVKENVTRVLKYKPHQDGNKEESYSSPCPEVGKLIYFLFAPTLVYSDNYPRTSCIRWRFVGWNLLQMICSIVCLYLSYICFAVGTFSQAGLEPIPFDRLMIILITAILPGSLVMIVSFYLTLHCWQNCVAEMMRFGDRLFYADWWNSTTFAKYYRSWNMLVHDWIYAYMYRDMYVMLGRSRSGAQLAVFLISAVIHEYILATCFKFVLPLLFVFYSTAGILLFFVTRKSTWNFWNVFLWYSLLKGYGLMIVFYPLEWYARINCPRTIHSWMDYIIPRFLQCNVISFPGQNNSFDGYPSDK